jgi:hypothetical protein
MEFCKATCSAIMLDALVARGPNEAEAATHRLLETYKFMARHLPSD